MFSLGNLVASGMTMPALADDLSMWVDRIVTDRTGLQRQFDLSLKWLPDRVPETGSSSTSDLAIDPHAPSIYTAVQEQLGLKLEALRGVAKVLVVERADRPTVN
jgi:bla regulator protein blaR1